MRTTDEQVMKLAQIERVHGNTRRVSMEDEELAAMVEEEAGEDAIVHCCLNCRIVFVIDVDGNVHAYEWRPRS